MPLTITGGVSLLGFNYTPPIPPPVLGSIEYLVVAGGGGGGGSGGGAGANGSSGTSLGGACGSGIVIIRYPDSFIAATSTTGSPTITTAGGYRVYKFTSSGSITF